MIFNNDTVYHRLNSVYTETTFRCRVQLALATPVDRYYLHSMGFDQEKKLRGIASALSVKALVLSSASFTKLDQCRLLVEINKLV